jgi:hypothetical protein
MKRKLKWTAVVLAVLLLGFGAAIFLWPRDRITAESWEKIRIGMTSAEVEEILGGPGNDFKEAEDLYNRVVTKSGKEPLDLDSLRYEPDKQFAEEETKVMRVWVGREAVIGIVFDPENCVKKKAFQRGRLAEPNLIDRLRDWLGW